jgi:hypothetical protein
MNLGDSRYAGSFHAEASNVSLFFDDGGVGNFPTVLEAADARGFDRVLVLGSTLAGLCWPMKIARLSPHRRFLSLETGKSVGFDRPGVYFASFDMLVRKRNKTLIHLLSTCKAFDLLVLDEARYLGNNFHSPLTAMRRDQGMDGIGLNAGVVWVLSGTLTPNHAGEVYSHLQAHFPNVLYELFHEQMPTQKDFENEFCQMRNTRWGNKTTALTSGTDLPIAIATSLRGRYQIEHTVDGAFAEALQSNASFDNAPLN